MKKTNCKNWVLAEVMDKVGKSITSVTVGRTEEEVVFKLIMSGIGTVKPYRDMEIYKIGEINEETGEFKKTAKKKINWEIYSLPKNEVENLATLGPRVVEEYEREIESGKEVKIKENEKGVD